MRHDLRFLDLPSSIEGPICRLCGQEITGDQWAALEDCPASCNPPGTHFWPGGADHCACGAHSDRLLVTLLMGKENEDG